MNQTWVSINGEFCQGEDAKISVFDRGFLFSDSVFETLVAFQTNVLDLDEHFARLQSSAESLEIPIDFTIDILKFEIRELLQRCNNLKSSIRLVLTRGTGLGLKNIHSQKTQKIIICTPAKTEENKIYKEGLNAKHRSLEYTLRGASAKLSNYSKSIMALAKAQKEGFDEILWTNSESEWTEASAANVFFIGRDGDLVEIATPPEFSGILKGITRQHIIKLLNKAQIPVTERIIYRDELARFDEAFVCSTVRGLVPLKRIDNHSLHTARDSSVFRNIERLFFAHVTQQLGYRVDWNTGAKLE